MDTIRRGLQALRQDIRDVRPIVGRPFLISLVLAAAGFGIAWILVSLLGPRSALGVIAGTLTAIGVFLVMIKTTGSTGSKGK